MSSTDNWTAIMGQEEDFGPLEDQPASQQYSPDAMETDDPQSPRSTTSPIPTEIHIDSMDSISQQNVNIFSDGERPRYRQNSAHHTNEYAQHIHSPRSQKYQSHGKAQAKLARIITVPEPNDTSSSKRAIANGNVTMRETSSTPRGPIPSQSTYHAGGSMRMYGVAHTSAVPGHMSFRRIPKEMPRGSVAFRRPRQERKEHNISQFDILLSKHERHRYLPGEEIVGQIIYDVHRDTEILCIELLIIGQASATFVHNHDITSARTKQDVFLKQRSFIVGKSDAKWNSLIKAGHYVSHFRFQLPDNVPSSVKYEDRMNGFGMEVAYLVKVRICDDIGSSSIRSTHSMYNYVKVLLSRKQLFYVKRPFDIHSIPLALTPVTHSEEIPASCSIFSSYDSANIYMSMERSCFLAGDDIRIRLETLTKHTNRIKKISCILEQRVSVKGIRSQATFQIANVEQKYPKGTRSEENRGNSTFYDILLPTHTTFIPSILPGCRLVRVKYDLTISIKLNTMEGKLSLQVPINIGPSSDPMALEKQNAMNVPNFNKPLRFPHFSPHSSTATSNGTLWNGSLEKQGVKVTAKHSYETCSSKFCCCVASETLI